MPLRHAGFQVVPQVAGSPLRYLVRDPKRRGQAVRLAGVAYVVVGMLASTGRVSGPVWFGYVLLALGLLGVFVLPPMLVRRWRTPR